MTDVERPTPGHRRPTGVDDATIEGLGKLSEALEAVETARGNLYAFHRLCGVADLQLGEAVGMLRAAGMTYWPTSSAPACVGRNILEGRRSFQVVEEYDDGYYATFRSLERQAREALVGGRRHLFEAEMKEDRRTHGDPDHTAVPEAGDH